MSGYLVAMIVVGVITLAWTFIPEWRRLRRMRKGAR